MENSREGRGYHVDSDVALQDIEAINTKVTVGEFLDKLGIGGDAEDNPELLNDIQFVDSEMRVNSYILRGREIFFTTQMASGRGSFDTFYSEALLDDVVTSFVYGSQGTERSFVLDGNNYRERHK